MRKKMKSVDEETFEGTAEAQISQNKEIIINKHQSERGTESVQKICMEYENGLIHQLNT